MTTARISLSDFPLSAGSLVSLLHEGRDGEEAKFNDQAIADWCFKLFSAIDYGRHIEVGMVSTEVAREVAYDVALQFEADFLNASGRVFDADLYQSWLARLGGK
jgi:hypothetical protein